MQSSGHCADLLSLPIPSVESDVWFNYIYDSPKKFISICRSACMLDTKLICMNQGYIDSISKSMKETKVSVVKVACPECGMCFKNDQ